MAKPDKHEKFRDLAEKRTNKALEAISRIGNLSNTQLYQWEDAELRKILKALRDEVSKVEARFDAPNAKSRRGFKL
ncbi:hypothetical protein [Qipengyuania zhejiangensis]|uniref:hypothetical protein n=1 Tax=Qipengyuania zhejiangensis TaxID=3077782 RepID=UPI002D788749|nr:hypothetical protein [Qipengyuania sp. Z2]